MTVSAPPLHPKSHQRNTSLDDIPSTSSGTSYDQDQPGTFLPQMLHVHCLSNEVDTAPEVLQAQLEFLHSLISGNVVRRCTAIPLQRRAPNRSYSMTDYSFPKSHTFFLSRPMVVSRRRYHNIDQRACRCPQHDTNPVNDKDMESSRGRKTPAGVRMHAHMVQK